MKKVVFFTLVLGLLFSGCAVTGLGGAYDKNGLPKPHYYVGGGFSVDFTAPVPGVLYVVEEHTRALISSESLDQGESFSVDMTSQGDLDYLEENGVELKNVKIGVYYVPFSALGLQPVEED